MTTATCSVLVNAAGKSVHARLLPLHMTPAAVAGSLPACLLPAELTQHNAGKGMALHICLHEGSCRKALHITSLSPCAGQVEPYDSRCFVRSKVCACMCVQEALLQCHMKIVEGEEGTVATPPGVPPGHVARMLVCHTQAGSVIGKYAAPCRHQTMQARECHRLSASCIRQRSSSPTGTGRLLAHKKLQVGNQSKDELRLPITN